jgi:hypothetical protein
MTGRVCAAHGNAIAMARQLFPCALFSRWSSRCASGPTVESSLSSAGAPTPEFGPRPEPGRSGHDDHNARPVQHAGAGHLSALHGWRAAGAGRIPVRLQRPDPRCLHPGPAPVHRLVHGARAAPVRREAGRHRLLPPRHGSSRPGPGDDRPSVVHDRRVLPIRRRRGAAGQFPGRAYCIGRGWTTTPTPRPSIATSSARC